MKTLVVIQDKRKKELGTIHVGPQPPLWIEQNQQVETKVFIMIISKRAPKLG